LFVSAQDRLKDYHSIMQKTFSCLDKRDNIACGFVYRSRCYEEPLLSKSGGTFPRQLVAWFCREARHRKSSWLFHRQRQALDSRIRHIRRLTVNS